MMHRTVALSDLKFICVNDRLRDVTLGSLAAIGISVEDGSRVARAEDSAQPVPCVFFVIVLSAR